MTNLENILIDAFKQVAPAWPLHELVAVNPFWDLKQQKPAQTFFNLEGIFGHPLLMPPAYYKEKYLAGEILPEDLNKAINKAPDEIDEVSTRKLSFDEVLNCPEKRYPASHVLAFCEYPDPNSAREVIDDISKHAAAYLDRNQALAKYPWQKKQFWYSWTFSQRYDKSMQIYGYHNFYQDLLPLTKLTPIEAIDYVLTYLELSSSEEQALYCKRLLALCSGWASQWKRAMQYDADQAYGDLTDFLAVIMAYDFAIFRHMQRITPNICSTWLSNIRRYAERKPSIDRPFAINYVWQMALEIAYQRNLIAKLKQPKIDESAECQYKFFFCIDVRSEAIRRSIEELGPQYQTNGIAGFFGLPLQFRSIEQENFSKRLPVFAKPTISFDEKNYYDEKSEKDVVRSRLSERVVQSYFRNMRKAPFASFLYVELFGLLSIERVIGGTWRALMGRLKAKRKYSLGETSKYGNLSLDWDKLSVSEELIDILQKSVSLMELESNTAPYIFIIGHYAHTSNNHFQSSLNCGACGGHSGEINARFFANLLNRDDVRKRLADRGSPIPEKTKFVAGIHDTVTDQIQFMDLQRLKTEDFLQIKDLKVKLGQSTKSAQVYRNYACYHDIEISALKRASNWAETRPEWGLSNNAAFLIAPREKSRHLELDNRVFLHDYNPRSDRDGKALAAILNGPVLVTNWINLQYFASATAPERYGSGNKIIHNITNEQFVIEGGGGDLRIGLSTQSIHDGRKLIHEPVRLSVFIASSPQTLEPLIKTSNDIQQLLDSRWVHMFCIDKNTDLIYCREVGGNYRQVG